MRARNIRRWSLVLVCGAISLCMTLGSARADEVRVVDARGLVRAVKISRGSVRVVVTVEAAGKAAPVGECVATNVDGLAAEKRAALTPKGECVFSDVGGGSWQIGVPQGFSWRVQVYE